jgi:DNA-binding response OmpR family regulator
MVSSRGSEDDKLKGVEAGANAYVVKGSFDQQGLLDTIERLVA